MAIIDHTDLDRVSAEELLESGVRVVVNVSSSQTGRFPNPGPLLLVRGGVRLIDAPGAELFDAVSDGELVTIRGASIFRNGDCVASGQILKPEELATALAEQRGRVTEALEAFAENTMRYLREEGRILAEGIDFPVIETRFRDRHALVVARGPGHKRDLRIVKPYIRDFKPVLVGIDGARTRSRGGLQTRRDRRRHGLGLRPGSAVGGGAPDPCLSRRRGSRGRAHRAPRSQVPGGADDGHQRGPGAPARA